MIALELVCRLIWPAKGRHGRRRRPVALAEWPLADFEASRPDLVPFAPESRVHPYKETA